MYVCVSTLHCVSCPSPRQPKQRRVIIRMAVTSIKLLIIHFWPSHGHLCPATATCHPSEQAHTRAHTWTRTHTRHIYLLRHNAHSPTHTQDTFTHSHTSYMQSLKHKTHSLTYTQDTFTHSHTRHIHSLTHKTHSPTHTQDTHPHTHVTFTHSHTS